MVVRRSGRRPLFPSLGKRLRLFRVLARCGIVRDCAFYPDKEKGPGAVDDGLESCHLIGTAGHW